MSNSRRDAPAEVMETSRKQLQQKRSPDTARTGSEAGEKVQKELVQTLREQLRGLGGEKQALRGRCEEQSHLLQDSQQRILALERELSSALRDNSPLAGYQQKSPQLTLVLLGEPGSGKSASGNTILGEKAFTSKASSMPVTTQCETQTRSICGTEVNVIDTPDFFDDSLQMQSRHILRCRELCEGVLCVYLLVIQIGRFTEGERDILERLEKALDTRVRDRAIILFTRGDDLTESIDEYVSNTSPFLKELIEKCGGRYQVFQNTTVVTLVTHLPCQQVMAMFGKIYQSFTGVLQIVWNLFGYNATSHKIEADKQVEELMRKIVKLV